MKIWIITVGEPLPIEESQERLLRAGILSKMLADGGHDVTWWTSTFLHMKKRHVADRDCVVEVQPGLSLKLLRGVAYNRNISIRRLMDHWILGRKFAQQAAGETKPDIILCAFPIIELSLEAVRYGQRAGVPVVLDVRDLWPDIFLHVAPRHTASLFRAMLSPYFSMTKRAFKGASAVVGINEGFVDWGVRRAERPRNSHDRAFPMGYPSRQPSEKAIDEAKLFWADRGVVESDIFRMVFTGNIGRQFEFEPIVEVAKRMQDMPVQFVICGSGDFFDQLKRLSKDLQNIILPGWVGSTEIWQLMRMAQAGLAPYHAEESFTLSLPNKPLEYFSAGLPVISSLPGALREVLDVHQCGWTYPNNDADGLEEILRCLMSDRELQKRAGHNALRLFHARFSAEQVYGEMIEYLSALSANRRTQRADIAH